MAKSPEQGPAADRQQGYQANIKALALSAFMVSWITIVQLFGAQIAHSQALLADCISSGVDALTYMGHIIIEWKKRDGGQHERSQLVVVACSLGFLIYFTAGAAGESWGTVQAVCRGESGHHRRAEGGADSVNGYITLAFALGGVLFDALCLVAFYRSNKETGSAWHMNMFAALLHVGADCLRSASTLAMSALILGAGYDATCLDAYTSLFISATITAGVCTGLYSWFKLYLRHFGCVPKDTACHTASARGHCLGA